MFWSLVLEPGKRYTKVADNPFHLSAAVLDTNSQEDGIVNVLVDIGDTEAIIANLSLQHGILQFPLDLQFDTGSRISFYTLGAKANVHLSGYVTYDDEIFSEDEDEISDEESAIPSSPPGKRKPEESPSTSNKKAKQQKVSPTSPNKNATQEGKGSPNKAEKKPNAMTTVEKPADSDDEDDDEDWTSDEEEEDGEEEEEEVEDGEEEGEEEEEEDSDEKMDIDELQKIIDKQKKGKALGNAVASKQGKQGLFPTKEPVNVFKIEKTPKGAKIPDTEGAKSSKKAKTPKGNVSSSKEDAKTPTKDANKKTPTKSPATSTASTLNGKSPKSESTGKAEGKLPKSPKTVKPGGVMCEDLVTGTGPEAKPGKMVTVYYEGRLMSNKKMFDKCDSGKGFKFRLGGKEVIKGWDVGVCGMKVGGKRRITCPPHMAYGKQGAPPAIPAQATLTFVVELKAIS